MVKDTDATKHGLSRRTFLKATGGAALLPLVHSTAASAAHPKTGGTLTISGSYFPLSLDPTMWENGEEYIFGDLVYSNLVRLTPEFTVVPELARSWEASRDAKVWTFHLNKGVKFHNGKELVADDVVFSIRRALKPDTKSSGIIGPINHIEALDAYTVQLTLDAPFADQDIALSKPQASIVPRWNKKIDTDPIGTGPFKFQSLISGVRIECKRFDDYFVAGLPYLDRVVEVFSADPTSALNGLLAGSIDVIWNAHFQWASAIKQRPGVVFKEVASPGYNNITMRVDREPFDDNRVRLALKYVIDRPKFVDAVLNGHGVVGNDQPVPPFSKYYNKAIPVRTQNYQKAKQLLRDAGFPNGLKLDLYTSESRVGQLGSAIAMKEFAQPAGIDIAVHNIAPSEFWSNYWKKETFLVSNWFGRPSINATLRPYFHTNGSFNYTHYSNKHVDQLLDSGRAETDYTKRKAIYDEVQKILYEEGPWLLPYFKNYPVALRSSVKNYPIYPNKWTWLGETWKT